MTESWEEIWERSQSSLEAIRNSVSALTSPTPRVLRVGQLDAESLDAELVQLLQEPITKALSVVNVCPSSLFYKDWGAHSWTIVRVEVAVRPRARSDHSVDVVQVVCVGLRCNVWRKAPRLAVSRSIHVRDCFNWCVSNSSRFPRNTHPNTDAAAGLPRNRLLLHGFLTVLVPYIHTRLRNNAMSNAWPEAPSSDRRRKLWDWMTSIESTHTALSLVSFVVFLWNGRCVYIPPHRSMLTDHIALYRYRTLTDRLLQMPLVPAHKLIKRNVSYEFMNRQMVWHAFTVSNSRILTSCMASYLFLLRLGIPNIHSPTNKHPYPPPAVRSPCCTGEANILDLASAFSQQTFTNTTT